jgi:hypothetical protein
VDTNDEVDTVSTTDEEEKQKRAPLWFNRQRLSGEKQVQVLLQSQAEPSSNIDR